MLEPCKDSKVFRPPNPWITGILSLMAEIYATDKLKLNLTFEIEMLFRNFINNLQTNEILTTDENDLLCYTEGLDEVAEDARLVLNLEKRQAIQQVTMLGA